jgi:hypothetical protein
VQTHFLVPFIEILRAAGRWPDRQSGYDDRPDARPPTERVDPSQQRKSLEAVAVSELQVIARFKMPSAHLLSMSDLASRGSIALR